MFIAQHTSRELLQRSFSTVVFDLDGVIIDSEAVMRYAFAESYRLVTGKTDAPIDEYMTHLGEHFPNILQRMKLPIEMWDHFKRISSERIDAINLFPGVMELIQWCHDHGYRMAILTGKDAARTNAILEQKHLLSYFDRVVTPEQIPHAKPAPDGLLYLMRELDCPAQHMVFIGDTSNDMLCAQRADVCGIVAAWGLQSIPRTLLMLSNLLLFHPQELPAFLEPPQVPHEAAMNIYLGRS